MEKRTTKQTVTEFTEEFKRDAYSNSLIRCTNIVAGFDKTWKSCFVKTVSEEKFLSGQRHILTFIHIATKQVCCFEVSYDAKSGTVLEKFRRS